MLHKVVCEKCRSFKMPPNLGAYKIPISRGVNFERHKTEQQRFAAALIFWAEIFGKGDSNFVQLQKNLVQSAEKY